MLKNKNGISLIVLVLIIVLVVIVGAVTIAFVMNKNNNVSVDNNNISNIKNNQQVSTSNEKKDNYESDPSLPGVLRINLENVQYCVDAPSKQIFNRGHMFVKMENYFVIYDQYEDPVSKLNYDVDISKITEASNVIEGMSNQFINACEEGLINAEEYKFTITNKENKTVNGWEMSRFEGEFELLYDVENPIVDYTSTTFVGYSMIKDGCPIYFVVVDVPSKGGGDEIGTIADKIAKTFREYDDKY